MADLTNGNYNVPIRLPNPTVKKETSSDKDVKGTDTASNIASGATGDDLQEVTVLNNTEPITKVSPALALTMMAPNLKIMPVTPTTDTVPPATVVEPAPVVEWLSTTGLESTEAIVWSSTIGIAPSETVVWSSTIGFTPTTVTPEDITPTPSIDYNSPTDYNPVEAIAIPATPTNAFTQSPGLGPIPSINYNSPTDYNPIEAIAIPATPTNAFTQSPGLGPIPSINYNSPTDYSPVEAIAISATPTNAFTQSPGLGPIPSTVNLPPITTLGPSPSTNFVDGTIPIDNNFFVSLVDVPLSKPLAPNGKAIIDGFFDLIKIKNNQIKELKTNLRKSSEFIQLKRELIDLQSKLQELGEKPSGPVPKELWDIRVQELNNKIESQKAKIAKAVANDQTKVDTIYKEKIALIDTALQNQYEKLANEQKNYPQQLNKLTAEANQALNNTKAVLLNKKIKLTPEQVQAINNITLDTASNFGRTLEALKTIDLALYDKLKAQFDILNNKLDVIRQLKENNKERLNELKNNISQLEAEKKIPRPIIQDPKVMPITTEEWIKNKLKALGLPINQIDIGLDPATKLILLTSMKNLLALGETVVAPLVEDPATAIAILIAIMVFPPVGVVIAAKGLAESVQTMGELEEKISELKQQDPNGNNPEIQDEITYLLERQRVSAAGAVVSLDMLLATGKASLEMSLTSKRAALTEAKKANNAPKINELTREITELEAAQKNVEAKLEKAQKDLNNERMNEFNKLLDQINKQDIPAEVKQQKKAEAKAKFDAELNEARQKLDAEVKKLNDATAQQNSVIENANKTIENVNSKLDKVEQRSQKEVQDAKQNVDTLDGILGDLLEENGLKEKVATLRENVNKAQEKVNQATDNASKQAAQGELNNAQKALENGLNEALKDTPETAANQVKGIREELQDAQKTLDDAQARKTKNEADLKKLEEQANNLEERTKKLKDQLEPAELTRGSEEIAREKAEVDVTIAKEQSQMVEGVAESNRLELERLAKEKKNVLQEIDQANGDLDGGTKASRADAGERLKQANRELAEIEADKRAADALSKSVEEARREASENLSNAEAKLRDIQERIRKAEETLRDLQAESAAVEGESGLLRKAVADLEIKAREAAIRDLERQIKEIEGRELADLESSLERAKELANEKQGTPLEQATRDAVEEAQNRLNSKQKQVDEQLKPLKKQLKTLEQEAQGAEGKGQGGSP